MAAPGAKKKTAKPIKAPEARRREAETIRSKLAEFGFPAQDLERVERWLLEFEEQGWGCTHELRVPHLGVSLLLQLTTQSHITSFVRLRALPKPNAGDKKV
jgi:hypothetical protein